eukprot:CAMPEP_0116134160 /NCGR_PEP_ID=MMETSP0329-20121206/10498_1 /TAXON_ID=697910 /ORGANISM="Pseudo-nitzschia arenysensis, Strain B593" /LENGTH=161 /DNA_ID=CAMNT_0003628853 /DNA_START=139 /DNA_END=624 /DNA_ORIENTATION=-
MTVFNKKTLVSITALCCSASVGAYTNSHDLRRNFGLKKSTASTPPAFAPQNIGSPSQETFIGKKSSEPQQTGLSQAAINVDAGLTEQRRKMAPTPQPHAAHGILSPEIVARMDENTINGRNNPAVDDFLRTYRRKGPMSCLEMLSDPEVLPHLTQAMRDIV